MSLVSVDEDDARYFQLAQTNQHGWKLFVVTEMPQKTNALVHASFNYSSVRSAVQQNELDGATEENANMCHSILDMG